ncbi:MAG: glutamate formimidoyltransferase [Flavipsychrobacter sp.]|nr:glutamate formimidoyltransferase [Flavipsychrobacter sp.]
MTEPILECIPNFSEGRDEQKINAIAEAIRSVDGAALLHIDASPAANRTVMTFAGSPEAVVEAAYRAIACAAELIDMTQQGGIHPRIGATDVCPLVPLYNMTINDAIDCSTKLSQKIGNQLNIPIYLYEHSASQHHRKALPSIRKGQYEGFAEKIKMPDWAPDFGPKDFNPKTGATIIGARDILVAFNISIDTQDAQKADRIAKRLRTSGTTEITENQSVKIPGLLPRTRAIGWYTSDFDCAQVSMNLLDYRVTSPLQAWETCKAIALEEGVQLIGSELIGLMPESCLLEAGTFSYLKQEQDIPADKALLVLAGIEYLKLNQVKPFHPQEKILEYALHHAGLI